MTRFLTAFAVAMLLEATAGAQGVDPNTIGIASFDPDDSIAPASALEGPGIKVGEGTVLHPIFGMETGVVSNVFYTANNPTGAGLLRLLAQIGTSSLSRQRLAENAGPEEYKGSLEYRADARASWDFLLSGNNQVTGTDGLGLGLSLHGLANPSGRWSFGFDNDYERLLRAANFETDANTTRDINDLGLKVLYHPRDRSLGGYLYYHNTIDVFERSQQSFADRMFNTLGLHPTWRWLPETQLYADVSQGVVSGIGSVSAGVPKKITSYPFTAEVGIATLLNIKTTFNLYGGYTNGFYTSGPSFSAPLVGADLGYRYSPLGRVELTYALQYEDSINANYYRDHVIRLSLQQLVMPFILMVQPEIHIREYTGVNIVMGPPVRDDVIYAVVAGIHYNFRDWIAATLNYRFTDLSTSYMYMPIGGGTVTDPSYVRHELLLGLRIAM